MIIFHISHTGQDYSCNCRIAFTGVLRTLPKKFCYTIWVFPTCFFFYLVDSIRRPHIGDNLFRGGEPSFFKNYAVVKIRTN